MAINLDELFDSINDIAYTMEYNANLEFAKTKLPNFSESEQEEWALEATNDTIKVDRENFNKTKRKMRKNEALKRQADAMLVRASKQAAATLANQVLIDNLTDLIDQLSIS